MGEFEAVISEVEGEDKLIAAANYLVRELGSGRNLTDESRKVLEVLLSKLSRVVTVDEGDKEEDEIRKIKQRLNVVSEKIMNRVADESMIWDSGVDEGNEYLDAVNGVRVLIERLESFSGGSDKNGIKESLRKAHDVLETAMTKLEDEFKHVLIVNQLPFELENMSFRSSEADGVAEDGSMASISAASTEDLVLGGESGESSLSMDLVNPDVVLDLKNIANAMISAGYERECIHIYTAARKGALDEFLLNHEIEKMSIEDVLKMDWSDLNLYIKKWVRVMRNIIRIYLTSEKWLTNQILRDNGEIWLMCFADIMKAPMMQLLNFGEAVTLCPRQPEKLIRILDMFEVVIELAPDIDALFSDYASSTAVRTEYRQVMKRLEDCSRSTFLEFKNAVASDISNPPSGGGIHRLNNYVMNYLMALTDFSQTLDLLLKEHNAGSRDLTMPSSSPDINLVRDQGDNADEDSLFGKFPDMTRHFLSITSALEANLEEKSRVYHDAALQHFFLLNNIHYMTRKVTYSELKHIFGEKWTRKHTCLYQQHAMEYGRATWWNVLSYLKEEGTSSGSGSRNHNPRERFQSFSSAFEEVYKTQTAWLIADERLREDLRTKISQMVIQAYWTFYNRHKNNVSERYIKYSTDDLETLLLDLFAGCPKSLTSSHRR